MKILLFDNYDSFTYNLRDYVQQCGADVVTVRNDELSLDEVLEIKYDGVLISPGPSNPEETKNLMPLIASLAGKKPILGICLGFQAIGLHFGATLQRATVPMHGKTSELKYKPHAMFNGLESSVKVCRYHSLVLANIPGELEVTAYADESVPMSFAHRQHNIWAHQFHPEAILTEGGLLMIKSWVDNLAAL